MHSPKKPSSDQEKSRKLKLNKKVLKDLHPADGEKVKGGVVGTAPVSDTCKTACRGGRC